MKNQEYLRDLLLRIPGLIEEDKSDAEVKAFLQEIFTLSSVAEIAFGMIRSKYFEATKKFAEIHTEMPAMYYSDRRINTKVEQIAGELGLGSKHCFDYSKSRLNGLETTLSVESMISIVDQIRRGASSHCSQLESFAGRETISAIKELPPLDGSTAKAWSYLIADILTKGTVLSPQEFENFPIIYADYVTLIQASKSYAESRLESRKSAKRKALDGKHPNGEPHQHVPINDQGMKEALEITKYQRQVEKIENMDLDEDCYRQGFMRVISEHLKSKLR